GGESSSLIFSDLEIGGEATGRSGFFPAGVIRKKKKTARRRSRKSGMAIEVFFFDCPIDILFYLTSSIFSTSLTEENTFHHRDHRAHREKNKNFNLKNYSNAKFCLFGFEL
ncbi:MAG: hypothetical protein HY882_06910, partial [Deltaproteobacteria bacterium]|nr:hypothetical protein [Deltaproteobacteria bacterium]